MSPQKRETSSSQFDAKLESPGRVDAKSRRERRVQSLLPDIARRRKAELEDLGREGFPRTECEGSTTSHRRQPSLGERVRDMSVSQRIREGSVQRSRDGSVVRIGREGSVVPRSSALETQTKQAVKQTVLAALRLHSISPTDADYKLLASHTITASMFALRHKMRSGKSVGMGEIGNVVEGILDIFVQ